MKNAVSKGDVVDYTAVATVAAGAVVKMSHILAVAKTDIAIGAVGAVAIEGVFELPKTSAATFVSGEKLLWDVSAGSFAGSAAAAASGDVLGGAVALRAGLNGETTCLVKLTPGNSTLTA